MCLLRVLAGAGHLGHRSAEAEALTKDFIAQYPDLDADASWDAEVSAYIHTRLRRGAVGQIDRHAQVAHDRQPQTHLVTLGHYPDTTGAEVGRAGPHGRLGRQHVGGLKVDPPDPPA